MDFKNMNAKNVIIFTDKNLVSLAPVLQAVKSLEDSGVKFTVFDDVRVEPTDVSFQKAIDFTKVRLRYCSYTKC